MDAIFVPLMFDIMKNKAPFGDGHYFSMLKKYSSRNPDLKWAVLDSSDGI